MKTVHVDTGKPYDVLIGRGVMSRSGKIAAALPQKHYQKAAIITDSTVDPLYSRVVEKSFSDMKIKVCKFVFPAGEASKQMDTLEKILSFLADQQVTRSDLLVALGGGVVGDITGFAAACYLRGVDYLQIPTTLLAAVDSSVGGKTAVNIPQGKNLVGAFWQPVAVVCDVDTLATLDSDIFADGMAEVIKYGCIWDKGLLAELDDGNLRANQAVLERVIGRCVEIKAQVVREDEHDHGLRQILNFGHTLGHAVEKESAFATSHGKAVAIGMAMIIAAGEAGGFTRTGSLDRLIPILKAYGLPFASPYSLADLCGHCLGDKKRSGGSLNLILLDEMGKCRIHPIATSDLLAFLGKGVPV